MGRKALAEEKEANAELRGGHRFLRSMLDKALQGMCDGVDQDQALSPFLEEYHRPAFRAWLRAVNDRLMSCQVQACSDIVEEVEKMQEERQQQWQQQQEEEGEEEGTDIQRKARTDDKEGGREEDGLNAYMTAWKIRDLL